MGGEDGGHLELLESAEKKTDPCQPFMEVHGRQTGKGMDGRRERGGEGGTDEVRIFAEASEILHLDKKNIHTPFLKSAGKNYYLFIIGEFFYLPLLKTSRPGFQTRCCHVTPYRRQGYQCERALTSPYAIPPGASRRSLCQIDTPT